MIHFNNYDVDYDMSHTSDRTNNGFTVTSPDKKHSLVVAGHNLTYDQWGVSDGIFDSFLIQEDKKIIFKANDLNAWGGIDVYETGFQGYYGLAAELAFWMQGSDSITDGDGDETIMGFAGDDLMIAGAGNDYIDGGLNIDTVLYTGDRKDFIISKINDVYTVSSAKFGTDKLINVEYLNFNQQLLSIEDALNFFNSPTADVLQQKLQISIDEARAWVMNNLEKPLDIYQICVDNGITNEMLANIVQPHFGSGKLTGAEVNAWFISQGITDLAPPSDSTADFLQKIFQLSMDDARVWVVDHLDTPLDIYTTCVDNGITSDMLADIVQPHFAEITLTGAIVDTWLISQGVPALT